MKIRRLSIGEVAFLIIALLLVMAWFMSARKGHATAATADRQTQRTQDYVVAYPVYQSTSIYNGTLVCINSTGYAIPCTDTANLVVAGVAVEQEDNSSGADGALTIDVLTKGTFKFAATSITQAMVGQAMYVKDSQTFDDTSTNLVPCGVLVDYDSATVGWIRIGQGEQAASGVTIIDSAGNVDAVNVETAIAEIFSDLAGSTTGMGASLVGLEDAAGNLDATDVEAGIAEIFSLLAASTTGEGASLVGIEDSGSLVTATDVEAALAEAFTHIQTAQAFLPIGLTTLRETDATNVPNLAAHGGILASDSTPVLDYKNGDSDSVLTVNWAASNSDPVVFQTPLPPDLNTGADVVVHIRAAMAGTTDTPTIASDSYFNEGDTKVEDASAAITGTTYAEYVITIAAADVPTGAQTLTCELTPGAHTTDILYLTAIWIEYSRSTLTQ